MLALPHGNGRYTVDDVALDEQIGCALFQEQPEVIKQHIGYWSRKLTKSERAYDTIHHECLAFFRQY